MNTLSVAIFFSLLFGFSFSNAHETSFNGADLHKGDLVMAQELSTYLEMPLKRLYWSENHEKAMNRSASNTYFRDGMAQFASEFASMANKVNDPKRSREILLLALDQAIEKNRSSDGPYANVLQSEKIRKKFIDQMNSQLEKNANGWWRRALVTLGVGSVAGALMIASIVIPPVGLAGYAIAFGLGAVPASSGAVVYYNKTTNNRMTQVQLDGILGDTDLNREVGERVEM